MQWNPAATEGQYRITNSTIKTALDILAPANGPLSQISLAARTKGEVSHDVGKVQTFLAARYAAMELPPS
jgi:hypothetical protein